MSADDIVRLLKASRTSSPNDVQIRQLELSSESEIKQTELKLRYELKQAELKRKQDMIFIKE